MNLREISPSNYIKQLVPRVLDLCELRPAGSKGMGASMGFAGLDATLGGFCAGRIIAFAGISRSGTSALLTHLALNAAIGAALPVLFVSSARPAAWLVERLVAVHAGMHPAKLASRIYQEGDWSTIQHAASQLVEANLSIEGRRRPTPLHVEDAIRAWLYTSAPAGGSTPVVVLDEVSELKRNERWAPTLERLRRLVEQTGICLLLSARVTEKVRARAEWRPTLDDLRPRALEHAADAIALLHREELRSGAGTQSEDQRVVELCLAKNELGQRSTIRLRLSTVNGRFRELDES